MMLSDDNIKAYDAAAQIIGNELSRNTSLTADASRRAARHLMTRFAAEGITLHGIPQDQEVS